jgi:hypothetical protein
MPLLICRLPGPELGLGRRFCFPAPCKSLRLGGRLKQEQVMFEVLERPKEKTEEREEGRHIVYTFQNRTFRLDKERTRARLAGKRVINGIRSPELNVLPLKYHEAYRIYKQMKAKRNTGAGRSQEPSRLGRLPQRRRAPAKPRATQPSARCVSKVKITNVQSGHWIRRIA